MTDAAQSDADRLNALGNREYLKSNLAGAERFYLAAVEADPLNADAWGNVGLVWHAIGSLDDALHCYNKALALDPLLHTTWANLGLLNEEMGFDEHAARFYAHALTIKPDFARALGNLAQHHLRNFDFVRGWDAIECRFNTVPRISVMRDYPLPRWDGLPTRKLAIWPEQGLGDQIIYSTLLHDLRALDQPFVCELDERLIPAFERSLQWGEFVPKGHAEGFRNCTAHVPIMSLGWHLRRDLESFRAQQRRLPHLKADRKIVDAYANDMFPGDGEKRVAISWRSFHADINKRQCDRKSASLAAFAPLGQRYDLQLVSVQYGDVAGELAGWGGAPIYTPPIDLFNDIEGVLAVIAACDVVVTTSNVTAHFAGALGKETYLISRGRPHFFYWNTPHEDGRSLWYPSVKVVIDDAWEGAIAKVPL